MMVLDLKSFNIVLLGDSFPVENVSAEEFLFGEAFGVTQIKLPHIMQGVCGKYALQVLPDRFQVAANGARATEYRIKAIVDAAKFFVEEFTSKRSIRAI